MAGAWREKVAGWLEDHSWLNRITGYTSPLVSSAGRYTIGGVTPIAGVTTVMRKRLMTKRAHPLARRRTVAVPRDRNTGATGAQRGSNIHEQVRDMVLHDARGFAQRHPRGKDVLTVKLLEDLVARRHWQPLVSEYEVYDEAAGMATRIDLIAIKKDGTPVFIEIKSGYAKGVFDSLNPDYYWRAETPLGRRRCTYADQAGVQVSLGAMMALRLFRAPLEAELLRPIDPRRKIAVIKELNTLVLEKIEVVVARVDDFTEPDVRVVPTEVLEDIGARLYRYLLLEKAIGAKRARAVDRSVEGGGGGGQRKH